MLIIKYKTLILHKFVSKTNLTKFKVISSFYFDGAGMHACPPLIRLSLTKPALHKQKFGPEHCPFGHPLGQCAIHLQQIKKKIISNCNSLIIPDLLY